MNTGSLGATLVDFGRNGLAVPILLLVMLGTLVLPLPPLVLDVLFTFNISLSLVVILAVIVGLKAFEPAPAPAAAVSAHSTRDKDHPATGAAGATQGAYPPVQKVLEQRCYLCHGAQTQMKNVRLDSPEGVKTHAQAIYQQVVVMKQMPMNNATGITDAERALISEWFKAGAKVE